MRDVIVIGGGPAGSTAALILARRGWRVMLIEQHRFPREKVCGECLSALGVTVLDRLGLLEGLRRFEPIELRRALLHADGAPVVELSLPRPMMGISRAVMDAYLLQMARQAGVDVRQPARCETLQTEPLLRVRMRDLTTNAVQTCTPSHVIVADGKSAAWGPAPPPTGYFGIKAHFIGVSGPRDAIELFGCEDHYGGLAAIEGNRWNAAFSVPAAVVREHRGNIDAVFERSSRSNRALRDRVRGATRLGPWLASPLPRFGVREKWPAGVIPVGNAAGAIEPIGGEGMGLALRSAEEAAITLDQGDGAAHTLPRLRSAYRSLWRSRRGGCRAAALAVSSPRWARAVLNLIGAAPRSGALALRLMGKSAGHEPL